MLISSNLSNLSNNGAEFIFIVFAYMVFSKVVWIKSKWIGKKYVAKKIGEECVIPLYGVWNHFQDIDFASLPDRFVLKSTHDCGGGVVCKDQKQIDLKKLEAFFEKRLKKNYFWWKSCFWRLINKVDKG